jgi:hypothetical protein
MYTESKIDANAVKKDLYKSKAMAKFSHYVSGNIYYTVELEDGIYQFPISTVDEKTDYQVNYEEPGADELEFDYIELSEDLGTTPFYAEMKGSDLNRWIAMAIKAGEFVKVS